MSELNDQIGRYANRPDSLGYTYRYYLDALYQDDAVKVLAVDGIAPTDENIRSGAYPFTTQYYGVFRAGDTDAHGEAFLAWILSDEGQACVAQAGYIPVAPREDIP